MKRLFAKPGSFPYYVFGIIVFFLSHGYSENYGLIPPADILIFFISASAVAALLLFFTAKKMGSWAKAGIITGLALVGYLFYGAFQNGLATSKFLAQLSRYRFLLPGMALAVAASYYFIKKSSKKFEGITLYANLLLTVLIAVDMASIAGQALQPESKDEAEKKAIASSLQPCKDCSKPDIYLIVMDEYWGNHSLKEYLNYDNHAFTSFLKNEGFFVAEEPICNYSCTPLSMASILNMKYLKWVNGKKNEKELSVQDYACGARDVSNGNVFYYLSSLGYATKNCSIFDFNAQPSKFDFNLLGINMNLITSKTLINVIEYSLLWKKPLKYFPQANEMAISLYRNSFRVGNKKILKTLDEAIVSADSPKFVYAHLEMPHLPYLYDSFGRDNKVIFMSEQPKERVHLMYLNYLIYANKVVAPIVSKIKKVSQNRAVIILMSDHGNRDFLLLNGKMSPWNNFNAIYLPDKDYHLFYDSMSNVNEFRVLFNTLFSQHLPMLKDSVAF